MHVRSTDVQRWAYRVVVCFAALALSACATLTSTEGVAVDASANWAVLSMENLSSTPLAGRQAAALIETRLRARGVARVATYRPSEATTLVALIAAESDGDRAQQWALAGGYRYALNGTVHEWNYKSASDREPVVGLTLTLREIASGRVLWQGTASRSGWGNASVSAVADRVVRDLLSELRMTVPATNEAPASTNDNV